ncbi:Exo-beta-1,3-glucanase, GH17 family [Mariniphaga anaerophila]|uniref:Endo-1,3-beta-glucanase btgC n=1 Tax=Mariniphaga anaerophila TaxID=1484053 RepID=A0A1M4YTU5_9BACT|nr:glycosyl hydrolase family 17 protein [Mariniphaga anaerophila]SHF08746.1 Exo-beta-1,3-glucanase, GH17 family [Mariniphaga anaerophila]
MSFRSEKILSLAGEDFQQKSIGDLIAMYNELLDSGVHGLCFSAYKEGQAPGSIISADQIRERIQIIKPHTNWIRTFSCTDGNEQIPAIAKEYGLKVMVGAWLSDDKEKNEQEIENLVRVVKVGDADLVAVGNEVLYREELTEEELLEYIFRVKQMIPGAKVGYVDAYYEFINRPAVTDACDVIYANCYPFWEGCHIDYSHVYMKNMYYGVLQIAKGKKVIISETGWPNKGTAFEVSEPSAENALRYFINTQKWSKEENIEVMYFSSFDESWKIEDEGDVGVYWGLWDKNGKRKYGS